MSNNLSINKISRRGRRGSSLNSILRRRISLVNCKKGRGVFRGWNSLLEYWKANRRRSNRKAGSGEVLEQVRTNGSNGNKLAANAEITATCFRLRTLFALPTKGFITPARVSYENKSARVFWNGKLVLSTDSTESF